MRKKYTLPQKPILGIFIVPYIPRNVKFWGSNDRTERKWKKPCKGGKFRIKTCNVLDEYSNGASVNYNKYYEKKSFCEPGCMMKNETLKYGQNGERGALNHR